MLSVACSMPRTSCRPVPSLAAFSGSPPVSRHLRVQLPYPETCQGVSPWAGSDNDFIINRGGIAPLSTADRPQSKRFVHTLLKRSSDETCAVAINPRGRRDSPTLAIACTKIVTSARTPCVMVPSPPRRFRQAGCQMPCTLPTETCSRNLNDIPPPFSPNEY